MAPNLAQQYFSKLFIAQVAPRQNQHVADAKWEEAHGDRVRIRIPGKHTSEDIADFDLPWAIVAKTTTTGNLNNQSSGLWGGEWVVCCYMDEFEQIPIILHVLGNNLSDYDIRESENGTTAFKRVDRFNSGLTAPPSLVTSVGKNSMPEKIEKKIFKKATKRKSFIQRNR